jgi:hypothetical protein
LRDVRRATRITVAAALITTSGCVKGFQGSNLELDLLPGAPVQALVAMPPMGRELPAPVHFTLYAIQHGMTQDDLFEIVRFELHHIVDTSSPCYIDVGEHVPYPGIHVSSFLKRVSEDTGIMDPAHPPASASPLAVELAVSAAARMTAVAAIGAPGGLVAVTSASTSTYPAVAAACGGPQNEIPPPQCFDNASNQLRLQLCQATWKMDPNLWEGTDRVLTAPLNGVTHGTAVGLNPINMAPVGGAQFFVDNALDNIDAYAIYVQADGMDSPGMQLFFGRPTMVTRGVSHIHLTSPLSPLLTSEMAVFADLGQDDVHF